MPVRHYSFHGASGDVEDRRDADITGSTAEDEDIAPSEGDRLFESLDQDHLCGGRVLYDPCADNIGGTLIDGPCELLEGASGEPTSCAAYC